MLQVLLAAGVISLGLSMIHEETRSTEWIDGFAILLAVAIVTTVTASNNLQKEKQFRAIEEKEKEVCVVVRNNTEMEIIADDVVVGMQTFNLLNQARMICCRFLF
jgi:magnesium-transporting ATPase (P-type)